MEMPIKELKDGAHECKILNSEFQIPIVTHATIPDSKFRIQNHKAFIASRMRISQHSSKQYRYRELHNARDPLQRGKEC